METKTIDEKKKMAMATCPDCGNKYVKQTGYCMSCKKKIKDPNAKTDKKKDDKKKKESIDLAISFITEGKFPGNGTKYLMVINSPSKRNAFDLVKIEKGISEYISTFDDRKEAEFVGKQWNMPVYFQDGTKLSEDVNWSMNIGDEDDYLDDTYDDFNFDDVSDLLRDTDGLDDVEATILVVDSDQSGLYDILGGQGEVIKLGVNKNNVSDVANDYMNQTQDYNEIYYLGDYGLDLWKESLDESYGLFEAFRSEDRYKAVDKIKDVLENKNNIDLVTASNNFNKLRGIEEYGVTYQVVDSPVNIRFQWSLRDGLSIESIAIISNNKVVDLINVNGMNIIQIMKEIQSPIEEALNKYSYRTGKQGNTKFIDNDNIKNSFIFKLAKKYGDMSYRPRMAVVYMDSKNKYAYTNGHFILSTTDKMTGPMTTINPKTMENIILKDPGLTAESINRVLDTSSNDGTLKIENKFYNLLKSISLSSAIRITFYKESVVIRDGMDVIIEKDKKDYFEFSSNVDYALSLSPNYLMELKPSLLEINGNRKPLEIKESYKYKSFDGSKVILMTMTNL